MVVVEVIAIRSEAILLVIVLVPGNSLVRVDGLNMVKSTFGSIGRVVGDI